MTADLQVVLGSSGGLGRALVDLLAAQGRKVRAVSRTAAPDRPPVNVEWLRADVSTSEGALAACARASTVYFAAQPPYGEWSTLFPAMTERVIAGASAAGAKLVMVDNLYMYGPQARALNEDTPREANGSKGVTRMAMENQLFNAHRDGRVRVVIGRLSDYFGPRGLNSTLSALVLEPALKGKAMRWPGDAGQPRTLHFLADAALGLAMLGDRDRADGEVWHLPSAPPILGSEFMALVNDALDQKVKAKTLGTISMRIGGLFSK
jgi:nucleoside-diphosphate-sugar epimerase